MYYPRACASMLKWHSISLASRFVWQLILETEWILLLKGVKKRDREPLGRVPGHLTVYTVWKLTHVLKDTNILRSHLLGILYMHTPFTYSHIKPLSSLSSISPSKCIFGSSSWITDGSRTWLPRPWQQTHQSRRPDTVRLESKCRGMFACCSRRFIPPPRSLKRRSECQLKKAKCFCSVSVCFLCVGVFVAKGEGAVGVFI